jgi:hypothetical protein
MVQPCKCGQQCICHCESPLVWRISRPLLIIAVAVFVALSLFAASKPRAAEAPLPDTRCTDALGETGYLDSDGVWKCRPPTPYPTRTYEPGALTGEEA